MQSKEPKSMAEEKKATRTPEQKDARRAAKIVAFSTWRAQWKAANPNGTADQRKAAWAEASGAEMRKARKTLKSLEKGGFKLVAAQA